MEAPWLAARQAGTPRFSGTLIGVNLLLQAGLWLVLLPAVDPLRDATRQVSRYVGRHARADSAIVIGNSAGHPPSLPFYHGQRFDRLEETRDLAALFARFDGPDPCALILSASQASQFENRFPLSVVEEFTSLFVDRRGRAAYFVVMNQPARVR